MKVRYIKSACVVVEHQGINVLCDPWLTDGIYYGSWYHYPPLEFQPEDFQDVDYIYISHIHPDHLDVETLRRMPKHIPVLIADFTEKFVLRTILNCGFKTVVELAGGQEYRLGADFQLEILGADFCDPSQCGKQFPCAIGAHSTTSTTDTLAVFYGGGQTLVNTNDAPISLAYKSCDYINHKYRSVDFLLTGYAGAGPYPQCYTYDDVQMLKNAEGKKDEFLNRCVQYIDRLKPKHFLPFAGQYTLGGKLHHLNRYRGVPELEELDDLLIPKLRSKEIASSMVLLNSGESFDIENEVSSAPYRPIDLQEKEAYIQEVLSEKSFVYESEPDVDSQELCRILEKAQAAMIDRLERRGLKPETSDWNVYFTIGNEPYLVRVPLERKGIEVAQEPIVVAPYLKVVMDPRLLRMILERRAHWNNAEIGSHIQFERQPDIYEYPLFHRLCYFHL